MNSNKSVWVALIVVALIAIGSYIVRPSPAPQSEPASFLGASGTRFPNGLAVGANANLSVLGALRVGSVGKELTVVGAGNCYFFFGTTTTLNTIVASTTRVVDCQGTNPLADSAATQSALSDVPAWRLGDVAIVTPIATSSVVGLGLYVSSAAASSTAGYITVRLSNDVGASLAIATSTGVKAQYIIMR